MKDDKLDKTVRSYTKLFASALKKSTMPEEGAAERYAERLRELYRSKLYRDYAAYPTIGREKVFAVIAMCLILKERGLSNDEIIVFVNLAFSRLKKAFGALERVVDALPCAYKIAEKWNCNDHDKRVQDGSVTYEQFELKDGRIEYNISKCMYVEAFAAYGIRELCKVFCESDTQAYANLTKHVNFHRYSDLSDGDCCHDVIVRIQAKPIEKA